jgi:DedD protein
VGSVILITTGIIIIPSVLDGQKVSYKDNFKSVPERPAFHSVQTAKTFPKSEFEQHLPQANQTVYEGDIVDAQDVAINNAANQVQMTDKEVLSNETIAVTAISKPVDFDKPITIKATIPKPTTKIEANKTPLITSKKQKNTTTKVSPFSSNAWVIQLGVFGLKANAQALEKKLNRAGYTTFNRLIKANNGKTLTKVYVGPELDKNVLLKSLSKVNKVTGLKGKLTSFVIKR